MIRLHKIRLFHIILAILLVVPVFFGLSCRAEGVLYPDEVASSLVDEVIMVEGKITQVVINPAGLGGLVFKLKSGGGEIYVRVQRDVWDGYDEGEKVRFGEGKTLTAEGVLFLAGEMLVVIHGKYEPD
ncbi:hypothetical protein ACFLVU_05635 [Chloroflexota bacterium]